jgi:hypothetical protein
MSQPTRRGFWTARTRDEWRGLLLFEPSLVSMCPYMLFLVESKIRVLVIDCFRECSAVVEMWIIQVIDISIVTAMSGTVVGSEGEKHGVRRVGQCGRRILLSVEILGRICCEGRRHAGRRWRNLTQCHTALRPSHTAPIATET